jgi:hypothetical protein
MKTRSESGIALISTLLVLVLLGALLTAFIVSVNSDQGLISVDRDQNRAYYAAQAGLERLTADIGNLFDFNYAPTTAQINALTATPPVIPGISFVSPGGGSGYQVQFEVDAQGRPAHTNTVIPSGPYAGLVGQLTPYTMTSTARSLTGAEVRMQRTLQSVFVPVFQFGVFSETDLSFFAGPPMDFVGRVHTNGNLFLAEGNGNVLKLADKVTAVKEVIRTNLSNGWNTSTNYTGTVSMAKTTGAYPGAYRTLARTEGSLVGTLGSAQNEPTWTNLSIGTYNGYIRNGRTGATVLNLPLVSMQGNPIDLIRRPKVNEDVDNPALMKERFFWKASLRIMLSDTAAQITSLPTVTSTPPIQLVGNAPDGTVLAIAGATAEYKSAANTQLIDGFIKIEIQTSEGVFQDVTNEILSLGVRGHDWTIVGGVPSIRCADQPNAIIRVQRFKDNVAATCDNTGTNYWPNVLYDPREGAMRDNINTFEIRPFLGGVMHYIELDINNLSRWFRGVIGASGMNAMKRTGGYVVYFSDRRLNRDAAGNETAEYGFEDIINPASASGTPNGVKDDPQPSAEDINGNGDLDTYGEDPTNLLPAGATLPLNNQARPWMNRVGGTDVSQLIARVNRPIFFRRALKMVNGANIDLGMNGAVPWGLTIASENPVYLQGNYNVPTGDFTGAHIAASVLADALTFLSNNWSDANSFNSPHCIDTGAGTCNTTRLAATTWYRTAIIAGKGKSFPQPAGTAQDFGTDGGMHNFFRFVENWGGQTLNYRGAAISLYFNRQAVGLYKCCTNVYSPPSRGYKFDTDFLDPNLLPPETPGFRDINITGFTRLMSPKQ